MPVLRTANFRLLFIHLFIYNNIYVWSFIGSEMALQHCANRSVTTMLTYPWKCTVLHCNHMGNTWKPLVLMTWHFDYCPSASGYWLFCAVFNIDALCSLYSEQKVKKHEKSNTELELFALVKRHVALDVAFSDATLMRPNIWYLSTWYFKCFSSSPVTMLPWEMGYEYKRAWRFKKNLLLIKILLHLIRRCWTPGTVFQQKIDSLRQCGNGTCHGGSFPTA